jgi:hypothetical protein
MRPQSSSMTRDAAVMAADDPDAHVEADGLVAIVQSTER